MSLFGLKIGNNPGGGGGASIGGAVTGATEGSVLFAGAGGILAQDNANLFWNDTDNRLGIGLNSGIDGKAHILGVTGVPAMVMQTAALGTTNRFWEMHNAAGTVIAYSYYDGNNAPVFFGPKTWSFGDSANEYFQIRGNDFSGTDSAIQVRTVVAGKSGIMVKLAAAQSANAFEVQPDGSTTPLTAIAASGAFLPVSLADGSAPNSSIYYSTTASRLVYKDSGGVVNNLY